MKFIVLVRSKFFFFFLGLSFFQFNEFVFFCSVLFKLNWSENYVQMKSEILPIRWNLFNQITDVRVSYVFKNRIKKI